MSFRGGVSSLPERAAPELAEELVQLCSFRVGDEDYVIDIMRIQEIVRPLPITPVRRGSALIEGVIDLRGRIIPVVDLRRLLGVPERSLGRTAKQVIVTLGGRVLAVVVDAVGRVLVVPRSAIQVAPAFIEADGNRIFPGLINYNGRLHLLLHLKALLEGGNPDPASMVLLRDAALEGG